MSSYCDILPEFYTWTEPVARKSHVCCECDAPILHHEKYFHARGKWEDEVRSYRQHLACCEACMVIRDDFNGGECINFGSLKEDFDEMRNDNWYPERDRYKPAWKRLRSLMAKILWRERAARNQVNQ